MIKYLTFGLIAVGFLSGCGKFATDIAGTSASLLSTASSNDGTGLADEVIQTEEPSVVVAEPATKSQVYNFVAGSKSDCDASIASRLNQPGSCVIGGGCSLDGFKPSAAKLSANPGLYGACITAAAPIASQPNAPVPSPTIQRRNVVAGDQSTCDGVVASYDAQARCTIGGGCALNGGLPTNSNPSANPAHYGACISL